MTSSEAYYAMIIFLYFFIEPWPEGKRKQVFSGLTQHNQSSDRKHLYEIQNGSILALRDD